MGRILKLTDRFQASRAALIVPNTSQSAALGATLGRLLVGRLPSAQDFEGLMPPVGVAWVRRVPGVQLWIFFRFDERELSILGLTNREPVRVD